MPIEVITGMPGNGKTAIAVERMIAAAAKGDRNVVAIGFDGLNVPGVTVLEDAKDWNAINDDGERLVPDGSLVFVDEAWKYFGHLHDASRQATPKHVLDLAEHRHRGLDFVWTTQMPNQLYPFVRGLIADHTHVVRRFRTKFLDTYSWSELNDDVKSSARRESALKKTRTLPAATFDKYKSATQHTIKARIPFRVYLLPVMIVGGFLLLYVAYRYARPDAIAANVTGQSPDAPQGAPGRTTSQKRTGISYTTAREYAQQLLARVPEAPWTAPAFDGRAVVSEPDVFCVESGAGLDANGVHVPASVRCMTEQGTVYNLDDKRARDLARNGRPYNPFKAPAEPAPMQYGVQGPAPAVNGANAPAPAPEAVRGAGSATELQAPYGAFRPTG